ncbi:hypothetical protein KXV95_003972 [Aspergillus fumigatus]|nr:hypothetical protein KXX36_004166 [Aspergillus fumigatus]KAH1939177.1 hypothetical protein KXV59_003061 [Aspergillus fumigatus]KAH1965274.1 hypothetical protein KXX04_002730 [Aspergillus fumigatus]KAH1966695.1 hypothetical protein KXV80_004104 [Aspergillus fumigatus]KAH3578864.1 hypothetical protein KXV95_003972 [Aspergillus fumigatus]
MGSASKVVFILGAGPRIGISVAKRFLKDGYKVAIGRRNPRSLQDPELKDMYSVAADLSQPSSVASAFKEVSENLGIPQLMPYELLKAMTNVASYYWSLVKYARY